MCLDDSYLSESGWRVSPVANGRHPKSPIPQAGPTDQSARAGTRRERLQAAQQGLRFAPPEPDEDGVETDNAEEES